MLCYFNSLVSCHHSSCVIQTFAGDRVKILKGPNFDITPFPRPDLFGPSFYDVRTQAGTTFDLFPWLKSTCLLCSFDLKLAPKTYVCHYHIV